MGTDVIINALNGELVRPVKSMLTKWFNRKNELTAKALFVLEQHAAREDKINANLSWTQQGQRDANRTQTTNETVPALKFLRNVIKDLQETDQNSRQRFFTIKPGIEDAAVRMPTYTYLWQALDPLDQSERITRFMQAAEADNVLVMAAMLENPFGAMVNEDVKQRALTERAKRRFPKDYETFEQNQLLLDYLIMLRDWLGRWLALEIGVEIAAIRDSLGDEIADILTMQVPGTLKTEQLAAAAK